MAGKLCRSAKETDRRGEYYKTHPILIGRVYCARCRGNYSLLHGILHIKAKLQIMIASRPDWNLRSWKRFC